MALIIAIEGLPGVGKTTAVEFLLSALKAKGLKAVGISIDNGQSAAELRLVADNYAPDNPARSLLFWIMRLRQYEMMRCLEPDRDVIIADRFWGTSLAYDVYGHGLPRDWLDRIGPELEKYPHLTLLLEAPLTEILRREQGQTMSDEVFVRRVEQGYHVLAEAGHWIKINAKQPIETVGQQCLKVILDKLGCFRSN